MKYSWSLPSWNLYSSDYIVNLKILFTVLKSSKLTCVYLSLKYKFLMISYKTRKQVFKYL